MKTAKEANILSAEAAMTNSRTPRLLWLTGTYVPLLWAYPVSAVFATCGSPGRRWPLVAGSAMQRAAAATRSHVRMLVNVEERSLS